MQTAKLPDDAIAWADMQVVCVGQLHLTAKFFEVKRVHRALDCARCAHVHKDRGLYRAVRGLKGAAARVSLGF